MIKLKNIIKIYENKETLLLFNKVSFTFDKNQIYYLTGSPGSGKTTLCNIILDNIEYEGKVKKDNLLIQNISVTPSLSSFFSVKENILLSKDINKERYNYLLEMFSLKKREEDIVSNLSLSEKISVDLIRILLSNFDVLIIDDILHYFPKELLEKLFLYLQEIKKDKIIIITSKEKYINNNIDKYLKIENRVIYEDI